MTKTEKIKRIAMVIQANKAGFISMIQAYDEIMQIETNYRESSNKK